jgi:gamma-glutamyl phosphate reductase
VNGAGRASSPKLAKVAGEVASAASLHARGPIALSELTTHKFVVHGTGQVRT